MSTTETATVFHKPNSETSELFVSADRLRERGHHITPRHLALSSMRLYDFELLASHSIPVVNYINEIQPHIAIALDRTARLFGLTVYDMWRETMNGTRFPTIDNKLHFARISTKSLKQGNKVQMQNRVDSIVENGLNEDVRRENLVANAACLRILFIDDWIGSGVTKQLANELVEPFGAEVHFAVINGSNPEARADVDGRQPNFDRMRAHWQDKPRHIGIEYTRDNQPMAVRSDWALANRAMIHMAVKHVASLTERRQK